MYVNASNLSNLELWSQNSITWVIGGHLAKKFYSACASAQGPQRSTVSTGEKYRLDLIQCGEALWQCV
jgi:hypothetical protein